MPNVTKTKAALAKTAQSKVESMFQPFEINGIRFRNRILAPPSVADQADLDGRVTPALIKYYRTLARQGVGTIIVESAYVTKQGRGHVKMKYLSQERRIMLYLFFRSSIRSHFVCILLFQFFSYHQNFCSKKSMKDRK